MKPPKETKEAAASNQLLTLAVVACIRARHFFGLWKIDRRKPGPSIERATAIQRERHWLSRWAKTRVTAEFCRAEIQQRFAGKKLKITIDRFKLNPGKWGHRAVFE